MLKWVVADPDTGCPDTFALEANGAALDTLEYMVPTFKLVESDVAFFSAFVYINNRQVHSGQFEWRTGTFSHKITEKIQDQEVSCLTITDINHSSVVTSEALSVLSKFKTPDTGIKKMKLSFYKLDEPVKKTVVDQFMRHAN